MWRLGSRLAAVLLPGCAAVLGIEDGTTQGACATADDCAPGYSCLLDQCRAGCDADADCGPNATCLDLGGTGACQPRDASCGTAMECPDGTECQAGRCRNLCDTSVDCPGGQECDRGYCFSAEGGVGGSGGMSSGGRGGSSGAGGSISPEGGMSGEAGGGVGGGSGGAGSGGKGGGGGSAGMSTEPRCGDGRRDTGETCDDGNDEAADGCTDCERDAGFTCSGNAPTTCTAICGDGLVVGSEALAGGCDDNGQEPDDGCSAACTVEDGWSCMGEPSMCTEGCGDGTVDAGEACDDGDDEPGDGCSACAVEVGFTCQVLSGGGSRCTDIDECTDGDFVCDPNAFCENRPGTYNCRCSEGWEGPGDTCTDINECENGTCATNATCMNSAGSFTCECPINFAGDGTVCQDARIPDWPVPLAPDYTASGGVVHDNVTGLDWQQETDGPYSRSTAVTHCQNLTLGGFSDWRLPTRIELSTLFFQRKSGGTYYIDETTFPDTEYVYWSSSPVKGMESNTGWVLSFGTISSAKAAFSINDTYYARCVRSVPNGVAPERFTALSSSLAQDNETGLIWTRSIGNQSSFSTADQYCDDLVVGEYSDFRLPTLPELLTLVNEDLATNVFFTSFFADPGGSSNERHYWTTAVLDSNRGSVIQFNDGAIGTALTGASTVRRRCVHEP